MAPPRRLKLKERLKLIKHALFDKDLDELSSSVAQPRLLHNDIDKSSTPTSNGSDYQHGKKHGTSEFATVDSDAADERISNVNPEDIGFDNDEIIKKDTVGGTIPKGVQPEMGRRMISVKVPGDDGHEHSASIYALPDTGASFNLITKSTYDKLRQGPYFRFKAPKIVDTVNGPAGIAIGHQNLFFSFKDKEKRYQADFVILQDVQGGGQPNWDVALGRQFLQSNKLISWSSDMGEAFYVGGKWRLSQIS